MTETSKQQHRLLTPGELTDVYDVLEQVRLRPGMWVRGSSLLHLESMLTGYRIALGVHDIREPDDFWQSGTEGHFTDWLWQRLGRSSSLCWAVEIEREAEQAGRPAMEMFFEFLDEFRAAARRTQGEATHSVLAAETEQPLAAD